jgi:hypothetical protein
MWEDLGTSGFTEAAAVSSKDAEIRKNGIGNNKNKTSAMRVQQSASMLDVKYEK